MAQRIIFGNLKSAGIVSTLFIMGLIAFYGISSKLGIIAITLAIAIGTIYGFLGGIGIIKKIF